MLFTRSAPSATINHNNPDTCTLVALILVNHVVDWD